MNKGFLERFLEKISLPTIILDRKSYSIISNSKSFNTLLGFSSRAVKGKNFLQFVSEKYRKSFADLLKKNSGAGVLELNLKNGDKLMVIANFNKFSYKKKTYGLVQLVVKNKQEIAGERRRKILRKIIYQDPLTRVLNYRILMKKLKEEFRLAKNEKSSLSLLLIDIDNFDFINHTLGLEEGDRVLKLVARTLVKNVRSKDLVGRFGEDAFLVVLPQTERKGALNLGYRILDALNSLKVGKEKSINITCTIAVVSYPEDKCEDSATFLDKAKSILNTAKEMGGNTVASTNNITNSHHLLHRVEKGKEFASFQNQLQLLAKRLHSAIFETVLALSNAVKAKDYYTEKHSEITAYYAGLLAEELGLPPEEVEMIKIGAILHDIGKIGISDSILKKPGPLNEKEKALIRLHPEIGANIIKTMKFLRDVVPIILYHHERYDGKGNRWGIKGEEIPLGARIVSVIDVYHALISDRPYRKALSQEEAIKIIKQERGKKFDPEVVDAFLKILEREKASTLA
jgi:diguanylate cyclase (GGDEF)-like protein/putative nucleotidyltransferase with HDIG domain